MDRLKFSIFFLLLAGAWLVRPVTAHAAAPSARVVGPTGLVRAGDTVVVDVRVDSAGRVMNALDLRLRYSSTYLRPLRVEKNEHLWPLWPEQPMWNTTDTISFVAGRPNGVIAIDASVAKVYFQVISPGLTQLTIDGGNSNIYLNNGQGTRLAVASEATDLELADSLVPTLSLLPTTTPTPDVWTAAGAIHVRWAADAELQYSYLFSTKIEDVPDDVPETTSGQANLTATDDGLYFFTIKSRTGDGIWSRINQFRFLIDRQAPDPFELVALPAPNGHGMTLSWTATDATSGVVSQHLWLDNHDQGAVTSPLHLRSSWAGKLLTIVVRDGAGNEQRAAVRLSGQRWTRWWWIPLPLIAIVLLIVALRRRH